MFLSNAWTGQVALVVFAALAPGEVSSLDGGATAVAPIVFDEWVDSAPDLADPLDPEAAGSVEIRSGMNHKCLEILSFNNDNGAHTGMWDCWGGANQRWYWDGSQIRSGMNNKCLEVLSFNNDNGARVGMWDCWGGANQRWYWDGDRIRSELNNKCLDVLAFNNDNGAEVGMWDCVGGANQRWYTQ
jgi:hypothetical protein